ncbi:citrate lyase holo-[acyl-carrier protein] synthase [Enterococcus columbae]|nr:citrate lyase holo-[acyl-carrier protein] synthase [Enterococcus columbae]
MCKRVFDGPRVTLEEMLEARENRANIQQQLLLSNVQASLLVVTMNIPGPVKYSPVLAQIFQQMVEEIDEILDQQKVLVSRFCELTTGMEYYLLVDIPAKQLKEQMVALESHHPHGRLFDLDVLILQEQLPCPISRQELGYPSRRCLICQEDAKVCGRSRRHDIQQMQQKISEIIRLEKE